MSESLTKLKRLRISNVEDRALVPLLGTSGSEIDSDQCLDHPQSTGLQLYDRVSNQFRREPRLLEREGLEKD